MKQATEDRNGEGGWNNTEKMGMTHVLKTSTTSGQEEGRLIENIFKEYQWREKRVFSVPWPV